MFTPASWTPRIRLHDDAGRETLLVQPPESWPKGAWRKKSRDFQDPALRAEVEVLRKASGYYGAAGGLCAMGTLALSRWMLSGAGLPGTILAIAAPVLAGVLGWPLYAPIVRSFRKSRRAELRAAYLAAGKCPSCGFDLSGAQAESDGLTMCAECGGRWRLAGESAGNPRATVPLAHARGSIAAP